MTPDRSLRVRRAIVIVVSLVVPLVLVVGLGHRGVHMARNIVFPGAGLIDERPLAALAFAGAAIAATVAWVRWGVDWSVLVVVMVSTAAAGALASSDAHAASEQISRSAHEFPLVIIVASGITWLRSVAGRVPGLRHLQGRRVRTMDGLGDIDRLSVVDRCRCGAIAALAELDHGVERDRVMASLEHPDIARRARRVGLVARGRRGGDPFRVDHAHARAALRPRRSVPARIVTAVHRRRGRCTRGCARQRTGLGATARRDARRSCPRSCRRCRRGPTMDADAAWCDVAATRSSSGLLVDADRRVCWVGARLGACCDGRHLPRDGMDRRRRLGRPARRRCSAPQRAGIRVRDDERLIAAGRVLLAGLDDPQAAAIVARPTVRHDPIAVALDRLATRLTLDPHALRTAPRRQEGVPVA